MGGASPTARSPARRDLAIVYSRFRIVYSGFRIVVGTPRAPAPDTMQTIDLATLNNVTGGYARIASSASSQLMYTQLASMQQSLMQAMQPQQNNNTLMLAAMMGMMMNR
jgi:hypothetical protein